MKEVPMNQPQMKQIKIPGQVLHQLQIRMMSAAANAIVIGDYEGSEAIPMAHKKIIGDMLLTMSQNPMLETAKCESCGEIRLEHELEVSTGDRVCKAAEDAERTTFFPQEKRIVEPPNPPSNIIIPGR